MTPATANTKNVRISKASTFTNELNERTTLINKRSMLLRRTSLMMRKTRIKESALKRNPMLTNPATTISASKRFHAESKYWRGPNAMSLIPISNAKMAKATWFTVSIITTSQRTISL